MCQNTMEEKTDLNKRSRPEELIFVTLEQNSHFVVWVWLICNITSEKNKTFFTAC